MPAKFTLLPPMSLILALAASWAAGGMEIGAPHDVTPERVLRVGEESRSRPAVVTGLSLSPGGKWMAAASDDHVVRVWNARSGEMVQHFGGHDDWVRGVAFSPDGRLVASAGADQQIRLWDLEQGTVAAVLPRCEHAISAIAFHPQGKLLAVVGFDRTLKLYELPSGRLNREMECRCNDIRAVAFSPDGRLLAASGRDGGIRVWQVEMGKVVADFQAHRQRVRALAWSPNSRLLASAGECRHIHIWDFENLTSTPRQEVEIPCPAAKILSLAFTSDDQLATGGSNNEVLLWNIHTRAIVHRLPGHTGSVATLAFDPDSGLLASGGFDTTIRLWNVQRLGHDETALQPRQPGVPR